MRSTALVLTVLLSISAHAATYTVSSSLDSGAGTLRQAILDANANPGADNIIFTTATVVATSTMPEITGETHIDGTLGGGRVDIQGVNDFTFPYAFRFGSFIGNASNSTLTRVEVRTYTLSLVIVADNVTVTDSVFETRSEVYGDGNTLNSGNTFRELFLYGDNNVVETNVIGFIGVSANTGNRIGSMGRGNRIGPGGFTLTPNIASIMMDAVQQVFIEGNDIASDWAAGIFFSGSIPGQVATISGNIIHGQTAGVAVFGGGPVTAGFGGRILGNSIYDVGLPIDLMEPGAITGPTPNDPAPDADIGGNNLQNYPVLTSAIGSPAGLTVTGTLTSTPLLTYRIELFGNPAGAPDEARIPLTPFDVTADGAGNAAFSQLIPIPSPPYDASLTATATNLTTNDTSEVSAPVVVDLGGQLSFNPIAYDANEYETVTLTVVRTGGTANSVTVNYTAVNGTATAPGDFPPTTGTLTFGPGVTSQTFDIAIVGDDSPEPAESFTVVLSDPTNGATIGAGTATVTIAAAIGRVSVPTASTWALLVLALGLVVVAVMRA